MTLLSWPLALAVARAGAPSGAAARLRRDASRELYGVQGRDGRAERRLERRNRGRLREAVRREEVIRHLRYKWRTFTGDKRMFGLRQAIVWNVLLPPLYCVEGWWLRISSATRLGWHHYRENQSADWYSMADMMDWQLTEMLKAFRADKYHDQVNNIRRVRIARHCLRRLIADEDADIATSRFPDRKKRWAERWDELHKADLETLGRQLRHMCKWDI